MTASKIQSRPNSFLTSSAATPRNSAFAAYSNPDQLRRNVSGTKRCLFGKPDSIETKRLYEESVQQDRQRFISRYGFDTVTGQPAKHSISSHSSSSTSSSSYSLRSSPTREYCRPNEVTRNGLCKDDPRKYCTRQQQQQQNTSIDLYSKYGKRQC
ncbi:uncharacterized protein LOC129762770 [Toxorhynchites rutilus septentrionalis]|uniref:uncharacterized protein LOC129762770 n=1 Tax=Toxorhynchites rutilus septentrionalis TaxID=329112 RepID=UPI002479CBAD|nr:uncharacterized protein LOC129762770 [Toxorhynchites rutilus septentrionalis]